MPNVKILQHLSPQAVEDHPKYLPGALPGQILIGESELRDSLIFHVEKFERTYLEWKPRQLGGTLVRDHGVNPAVLLDCLPQSLAQRRIGRFTHRNGNEVDEYTTYYSTEGLVLRLTSTMADVLGTLQEGHEYVLVPCVKTSRLGKFYAFENAEVNSPAEAKALIRALRNRADYLVGYTMDSTDAPLLRRAADEIEQQVKPSDDRPARPARS